MRRHGAPAKIRFRKFDYFIRGGVVVNLQHCRAEEARCRRYAESDQQNRDLWLSMAERWSYLAKEAPFYFREGTSARVEAEQRETG
jgi:hypothetical protein